MRRVIPILIGLFLLGSPDGSVADAPPAGNTYLSELLQKARDRKLADARFWLLLLHYRHSWSEADDKGFFFAENGKTDPQAELEATLARFFDPPIEETEQVTRANRICTGSLA